MARQIIVDIVGDSTKFRNATEVAGGSALKMGAVMGVAAGLVDRGLSSMISFATDSIKSASDLNETVSKVGVVFGDAAADMLAWGKNAATAMGMSQNQALSAAGTYGNLFVSMGITGDAAATMSQKMVGLAADLASFNNASPEETLAALQSGLVGETEPLRKFGINLNDATLRQKALDLGLVSSTKDVLPPAIKAQAAYALILDQSTTAQGDFTRTSSGLANQQRISQAKMEDLSATIGTKLLPVIITIQTFIVDTVIPAFSALGDAVASIGDLFATLGAAIEEGLNPGSVAVEAFAEGPFATLGVAIKDMVTNVMPTLSAAFAFVTDTVIPALGAAFEWIRTNIFPPLQAIVQAWVDNILPSLVLAFDTIVAVVRDNWPTISAIAGMVAEAVKTAFQAIAAVIEFVAPIIKKVAEVLFPAMGQAAGVLLGVIKTVFETIGNVWNNAWATARVVSEGIGQAFAALGTFVQSVWTGIGNAIRGAINGVIGAINGIIRAIDGLQVHIHLNLPDPLPDINFDWWGLNLGYLPYLHSGGIVPGAPGSDVLAILQAGERVIPANQANSGGTNITINVPGGMFLDRASLNTLADMLADHLRLAGIG